MDLDPAQKLPGAGKFALGRRGFLSALTTSLAAVGLAQPGSANPQQGPLSPFPLRGYYVTFMRMPTYGLAQWKAAIDCFADDGTNFLQLWTAGAFRSKKFPVTWRYNESHQNVRS